MNSQSYPINKTNIFDVGEGVKATNFTINLPTKSQIKKSYSLTLINSYIGSATANLLKDGRVGIVLNVTPPSTYNTTICMLETSIRPTAQRTIIGFNGTTPVAITIGIDGSVKCPTTVTGTIEVNDTYTI